MGTKVHHRSYFPGHDKMRDLNADGGNRWPSFYMNKTLNEHPYNGCFPSPLTGYSEYNKEMLKRTMLEHEAIFRKQVYELHRLYGIQKDLMEEFQKNGLSGFSENEVPSKTVSCSSQVQSEYATRMLQLPINNGQKREKARYNNEIIYPVKFLESNLQSSSGFLEPETLQRVVESDGSFRKCPNGMLDFRLPAVAYIDDTERSEEILGLSSINTSTCSKISTGDSEIKLKLSLVSASDSSSKEEVCKSNYLHNKSLFTGLADLNEPNKRRFLEGGHNSFPVKVFGPKTQLEENHKLNFPLSLTTFSLQNAFTKDGDYGERTYPNIFQGVNKEISRGTAFHNETGKLFPTSFTNSTSHKETDPMLCKSVKLNVNKVSDIISIDHNEASTRFGHEEDNHFLISGRCPEHSESRNFGKLTSVLPNSFSSSLKLESNMTSLPLVPTWMKLSSDENHASSSFSAISSFDGSSRVKKISRSDIATKDPNGSLGSCHGIDVKSSLRFEEKSFSLLNGLKNRHQLESHSSLQMKFPFTNINLNVEAENSFSGTQDGPVAQQNKATKDIDGKCVDFLPGLSWLKRRPACESLEPIRLPSQVDSGFSKMNPLHEKKSEDVTNRPSCYSEVFSSSLHKRESKIENNQPSDSLSSAKFIGPNFDKLQQNLLSTSNEEKLAIDELKHVSMPHDIKMSSSEKSTSVENNRSNSRNCIDLNSMLPFVDEPDSTESLAKVQADAPSIHLDPILVSRVVPLIDLEAPVMTLQEDNITSDKASTSFICRDGLQEELCSREMLIKEAAENIVKLSLDKRKDEIQSSLSAIRPDNALYEFAEMILSNNNSIELNAEGDCYSKHGDDGLDLFELMTLHLEEMKPEKLWCSPQEAENAKMNDRSKASLLLAKPRKVQGKKRRQRKDFQKDILPALATLSRQESKEDLQAIGELMKATGTPWQAGIRRRNLHGNGAQVQANRKRQKRNAAVSIAMVQINPPTTLFMVDGNNYNPEFEVDRHHMIGWGRTTRRCRSQRCPSVSISSTLM